MKYLTLTLTLTQTKTKHNKENSPEILFLTDLLLNSKKNLQLIQKNCEERDHTDHHALNLNI